MRTTPFSQIPTAPLHWLWHPYVPLGKLTLLAGDPASGKTSLALHLAASLSKGTPLNNSEFTTLNSEFKTPSATLLLSPDDNAADTLRPRLESFHANLDLIHTLPDFPSLLPTPTTNPHYLSPLQQLDEACQSIPNLALLIIDPLTHYLGLTDKRLPVTQHSALSPQHSSCLHALALLAHKHHIALLLTTRLAKSLHIQSPLTPSALHRPLGSSAFTTTPRSVLLLTPIPDTQHPSPDTPVPPTHLLLALKAAVDWLRTALADGPVHCVTLIDAARQNAIPPRTLIRAKSFLAVASQRHPHNHKWFWSLLGDRAPLPRDPFAEALSHFGKTLAHTEENLDLYEQQRQKLIENPQTLGKHREFSPKIPPKP